MKNQRSFSEQLFQMLLLGLGGMLLFNYFFGNQQRNTGVAPRTAPALVQAFKGVDPTQGAVLGEEAAEDEIKKLRADIEKNPSDALAQWSKLRIALLQQYITGDLEVGTRSSGILGFGPKVEYYPAYEEIANAWQNDAVEAQALYQAGDRLWRKGLERNQGPTLAAATTLQSLTQRGRGNPDFLKTKIYVPNVENPATVPLDEVPAQGFRAAAIQDLKGTLEKPLPYGLLTRVDAYYSTEVLYKIFDSVVRAFGNNPAYSYGLAILAFALFTRIVMQPIYQKQYNSMRGMALIAPEIKKLQEKYKGKTADKDAQMNQMREMQGLYKKHGVNPYLGCGLALVQLPIFFFIVYPMIQHYEPRFELARASFLWIDALARPDIPLLVMYAISMFLSFRLSATPPTDEMQRQQQIMFSFASPLFALFLWTYPSAFTLYWMSYNVLNTVFQWRMAKAADPDKNLWRALSGADLRVKNPNADAVPAHPKNEATIEAPSTTRKGETKRKAEVPQSEAPLTTIAPDEMDDAPLSSENGASNGAANGSSGRRRGKKRRRIAADGTANGAVNGHHGSQSAPETTPETAPEDSVLSPSEETVARRNARSNGNANGHANENPNGSANA